jgi:hypothetical protein
MVCTAPTATWSDQATWNHPVGFIESGGFAMKPKHSGFYENIEEGSVNPVASAR